MVVQIDALKLVYMPVPKAACSTVKQMLARLDPEVDLPPEDEIDVFTWHKIYPTLRFRRHRWVGFDSYFRFCVLRDPIQRLLAVYTNRVMQMDELKNSRNIRRGHVDLPAAPDPDTFFQNLTGYRAASSMIKHHTLPSYVFVGAELARYSRIYKIEQLSELSWDLSRLTGQDVALPHANASPKKLRLEDLQPKTLDALRSLVEEEYQFLSGLYENPLGAQRHGACAGQNRRVS